MAPRIAPGKASETLWPEKDTIDITIDPNPNALRSVTCNFTVRVWAWAANMRPPARRTPACSDLVPASIPGLSDRNTSGRWNESATWMK